MPSAIRRIHSKYLGDKVFPKDIAEFEIREFFTLSAADLRAIRVDSNQRSRVALPRGSVCRAASHARPSAAVSPAWS